MPDLMAWADIAVSGGGSTSWENAFMGLPALMLVLAENQRPIAERLDAIRVGINLGDHSVLTAEVIASRLHSLSCDRLAREVMSKNGRQLIDGEGADRVLLHLTGNRLRLREAREGDRELLWHWANDPESALRTPSLQWRFLGNHTYSGLQKGFGPPKAKYSWRWMKRTGRSDKRASIRATVARRSASVWRGSGEGGSTGPP